MAGSDSRDNRRDELWRSEGTCCVMHQHDVDFGRECDHCASDRLLTTLATGEYLDIAGDVELTEESAHLIDKIDRCSDDDEIDDTRCGKTANGVHEQRNTTDFAKCLGSSGAETLTLARSGYECCSGHGCSPRAEIEVFA
jgi:hypothetical protein